MNSSIKRHIRFLFFLILVACPGFILSCGTTPPNRPDPVDPKEPEEPRMEIKVISPAPRESAKEPAPPHRSPGEAVRKPAPPAPSEASILKSLTNFTLEMLTDDKAVCPGPDGKGMHHLGRMARFRLVLRFNKPPIVKIAQGDLSARIGDGARWKYYFTSKISELEHATEVIDLNSLESGLETGPLGVFIFHEKEGRSLFLGKPRTIVLDTRPPGSPKNLRVTERRADFYTLAWDAPPGKVHEYRVEQWRDGSWKTISSGFSAPFARINQAPGGRVRVVALDCAGNVSKSGEASTDPPSVLTVTAEGRGKNKYGAYVAATVLVNAEFVKMYVSPWLEEHTSLDKNEVNVQITQHLSGWVPPGIRHSDRKNAKYNYKDGLWSAEIEGSLDKKAFEVWIKQRSTAIID